MKHPLLLWRWAAFALAFFASTVAWAQPAPSPTQISISFDVDPALQPKYLCVVTRLGASAAIRVSDLFEQSKSAVKQEKVDDVSTLRVSAIATKVAEQNTALMHAVAAATKQESDAKGDAGCNRPGEACVPDLRIPETTNNAHFLLCTENGDGLPGQDKPRIAVVDVEFHRDVNDPKNATINAVTLKGNIAQLSLLDADAGKLQFLSATVRGGDYADTQGSVNVNGHFALHLVPKCQVHDIELPPIDMEQCASVEASLSIPDVREADPSCLVAGGDRRRFRMWLPHTHVGRTKELKVTVTPKGASSTDAELRTRWTDGAPPEVPRLRATTISFSWLRHCLYPGEPKPNLARCPPVHIVGVASDCTPAPVRAGAEDICDYRCAPRANLASELDLPARVHFIHGKDQSWDEELTHGNQRLNGYVPLAERRVVVDLSQWRKEPDGKPDGELAETTDRRAARIRYIAVRDSSGNTQRVAAVEEQRVALPGAQCHQVVSYDLEGDREYEEQYVPVDGGRILLRNPFEHAKTVTFGAALGAGTWFGWPPSYDPDRNYQAPWFQPYVFARFDVDFRLPWPVTLSPRTTFMLGRKNYFPIPKPLNDNVESASVPFNRLVQELAVVYHVGVDQSDKPTKVGGGSSRTGYHSLGLSGGLVVEAPLLGSDFRRAGGWHTTGTLAIFGRPFLSRWVSGEILIRWIPEQTVYLNTDYRGDALPRSVLTHSIFGELGFRYGR